MHYSIEAHVQTSVLLLVRALAWHALRLTSAQVRVGSTVSHTHTHEVLIQQLRLSGSISGEACSLSLKSHGHDSYDGRQWMYNTLSV